MSFADTVDDNCSDIYSDRRYVTSPRSKLHCEYILSDALLCGMFSKSISTTTAAKARQDKQHGKDQIIGIVVKCR